MKSRIIDTTGMLSKKPKPLTEDDIITFGKFKGQRLRNIPAWYFITLYDNDHPVLKTQPRLKLYIEEYYDALYQDYEDEQYEGYDTEIY